MQLIDDTYDDVMVAFSSMQNINEEENHNNVAVTTKQVQVYIQRQNMLGTVIYQIWSESISRPLLESCDREDVWAESAWPG